MSILHSQDVHLIDYLRVVYKRRFFFAVVILAALGGTIWSTYRQTPIYASTARILLDNEATLVDFPGIERHGMLRLDTEQHIMRSREVAEHAVRTRLKPGLDRREPEFEGLVNRLISATGVDVVRNTLIVEMRTLADDPVKARDWCEAMAESYVEVNFDAKKQATSAAATALKEQIEETERQLAQAERQLMEFKQEYNLVSDRAKQLEQEKIYGAGTNAKVEAALKRVEFENKHRALNNWYRSNDFTMPLPAELAPNTLVMDLYSQIVKKRMERAALLVKYREEHPKVQAVTAEVSTLQRSFDQEIRNALEVLQKNSQLWATIGEAHGRGIEEEKREFLRQNELDWQYNVRQRNVEVKQEIYRTLLQKLNEVNVMTSIVRNNVRIIERPKAIPFPIRPNWKFNLLVGLVFGLAVAVAGVFFLEYLDKTLKTPDDVARYLELPVLAVVPLARSELLRAPYQPPQLRDGDQGVAPA